MLHEIISADDKTIYQQKQETHHQGYTHAELELANGAIISIDRKFNNKHDALLEVMMEAVHLSDEKLFTVLNVYLDKVVVE